MRRRAALVAACLALPAAAQEIEPRAYSASPVGTNFAVLGYGGTTGDVVFDSSAPFTDVEAEVSTVSAAFGRVFALGGRQASLTLVAPYQWGEASGSIGEDRKTAVNGVEDDNRQDNFRLGATLSTALGRGHSLKLTYSDGAVVRVGGDFRSLGVAWQYTFFD